MSKIKVHHKDLNYFDITRYQAVAELDIEGSDIESKLTQAWIRTQNLENSWATQSIEIMESVKKLAGNLRQRSTSVGDMLEDLETGLFYRIEFIGFSVLKVRDDNLSRAEDYELVGYQETLKTSFN